MSVQAVLLPVFVLTGLAFTLLMGMAVARTRSLRSGETGFEDIALREPNWSARATQIANCFSNEFEVPVSDRAGVTAASRRFCHSGVVVGIRHHPVRACRHLRDLEQCSTAGIGVVRGRGDAAGHVDLFRAPHDARVSAAAKIGSRP